MNPFFFGKSAHQLFGAYEPPEGGIRGGIVLCSPLGDEYLYAHPTFRFLARQLAGTGYHVLRFDYSGTGDSAGDFEDSDRAQWASDIETAIIELKDIGSLSRIGLVGMRYGGTLAAHVARTRSDIDQLVLWDVVSDGRQYLEELTALRDGTEENIDLGGVVMTPQMRREIGATTVETFDPPLPRTLVAVSAQTVDPHEALRARLVSGGVDCTLQHIPDVPAWRNDSFVAAAMPVASLRSIVEWMS
jgi:pimeloyl-ACP methyl ester carboxylesterase